MKNKIFEISHKKMLARFSTICVFVAAIIFAATMISVKNNDINTNATTGENTNITVNGGTGISYGERGGTKLYSITNSNNETIRAYCVEPSKGTPADTTTTAEFAPDAEKYNKIKLMIYLQQHQNSAASAALDYVWQGWRGDGSSGEPPANEEYAWTHAIAGAIYTDGTDYKGVVGERRVWVDNAITRLGELISGNNAAWVIAKDYQLFIGRGEGDKQDVAWIERPARGDVKFVKIDANSGQPMSNVVFQLSALDENNNVIESHIVVSNNNGVVDTSLNYHSVDTNGYDTLYNHGKAIEYTGAGTWFGLDDVDNSVGALLYGKYIIQEIECDANNFCYDVEGQTQRFEITTDNQIVDLKNWENDCAEISLGTVAVDDKDGDKYIEVDKKARIKDTVNYCVKEGLEYTIVGTLFNRETGEELLIDNRPVVRSIIINPSESCGEIEMLFDFDASNLGGKTIVVKESLYYENELIYTHDDLNDEGQTVEIVYLKTIANDNFTGEKTLSYDSDVEIKDVVKYCLKPGLEYTIRGVLMNKETGEAVKNNGESVTSTITFTPEETCGELEMIYKLNTTGLEGSRLVIFESLFRGEEKIIEHSNLNDEDQTTIVEIPAPNTGTSTKKHTSVAEAVNIEFIVGVAAFIGLGGYVSTRIIARRRIFRKKIDF